MGGAQLLLSEEWHPRVEDVNINPPWQFWGLVAGTGSSQDRMGATDVSLGWTASRSPAHLPQVLPSRVWRGCSHDKVVAEEIVTVRLSAEAGHSCMRGIKVMISFF